MIIACPACATRYVVADDAIGASGRTVRCAKCRHSWFEEPPEAPSFVDEGEPAEGVSSQDAAGDVATEAPTAVAAFDEAGPAAEAPPPSVIEQDAVGEAVPPPVNYDPPSSYDPPATEQAYADAPTYDEAPAPVRRRSGRLWVAVGLTFAVLVAGLIGAASYWGVPDWLPIARPAFAAAQPDLVLKFPVERQDRRTLENGTEFFGASGSVTNIGRETRRVPPILIVLRDAGNRIVYTWEVTSPKAVLAPGESVTINEAVTDVPPSARVAEIGWKPV